ncbi:MAG: hypothetical protein U1F47_13860 [Hyphomicrobiales bacterium]
MALRAATFPRRHFLLLAAGLLAGCDDDVAGPYLDYAGGGFIFNYRTANHYYGLVVRQKRPLPEGSTLEVHFEVPGGEEVQRERVTGERLQYKFQTGDLSGIQPGHPYKAVVLLLDVNGKEIARLEHSFSTAVDQSKLPDKPLVKGPGYEPAAP